MKIRKAQITDCFEIAELHINSWKAAYKDIISASYLDTLDSKARTNTFEKIISKNKDCILVTEENNIIKGFVLFGRSRDYPASDNLAEVWAIYVSPQSYGNGYGTKLLHKAEQKLIKDNYFTSVLWVLEANTKAINFYKKHGYKNAGKFKIMEKLGNLKAIEMIKNIEQKD